jgi:methylated-DNA-[protein]-cysteine S-methyltransferase
MRGRGETELVRGSVLAPIGRVGVVVRNAKVVEVRFRVPQRGWTVDRTGDARSLQVLARALKELQEYFTGERRKFTVPIELDGTDFQVDAWKALSRIGFGRTSTYKEQATSIGRPTATRAVGAANGRNPIPVILPCHRVVGADGTLTGFSGGIDIKKWLLAHEQDVLSGQRTTVRS